VSDRSLPVLDLRGELSRVEIGRGFIPHFCLRSEEEADKKKQL
jgi:hypothetical protein